MPIADPIAAIDDPRIDPYRNVRDRDLAGAHGGRFIVEGETVLDVAVRQDLFQLESVLLSEKRVDALAPLLASCPAPVYVAPAALMEAIVGFPIHRGVLAIGLRGAERTVAEVLAPRPALVVGLCGITNHDNVGGIFRNAAAFGVGALLIDGATCDPLYRKALRVSVGGVLRVPHARLQSAEAVVEAFLSAGYAVYGLSPRGERRLDAVDPDRPAALLLGAEGPGLSEAVMAMTETLRIDMAGGFDSLNVATTSGIALYELSRGRIVNR